MTHVKSFAQRPEHSHPHKCWLLLLLLALKCCLFLEASQTLQAGSELSSGTDRLAQPSFTSHGLHLNPFLIQWHSSSQQGLGSLHLHPPSTWLQPGLEPLPSKAGLTDPLTTWRTRLTILLKWYLQ